MKKEEKKVKTEGEKRVFDIEIKKNTYDIEEREEK